MSWNVLESVWDVGPGCNEAWLAGAGLDPPEISGVVKQHSELGGAETKRKRRTCPCRAPYEQRVGAERTQWFICLFLQVPTMSASTQAVKGKECW